MIQVALRIPDELHGQILKEMYREVEQNTAKIPSRQGTILRLIEEGLKKLTQEGVEEWP